MSARAAPLDASPPARDAARYGRVAAWLHWSIGLALLAQIAFGFLLDTLAPRGAPARAATINLHKSVGILLGLLIVARLAWRWRHAPPSWPAWMSAGQRRAARAGHGALYACMVVMPLAGYVASNVSPHGVRLFGLALPAWGPDWPAAYAVLNGLHVATAFVFAALIAGHVGMVVRHGAGDRAVLGRMSLRRTALLPGDSP